MNSPGNLCCALRTESDRGFTLLESIVAVAIAGMMALSVVTMMAYSVSAGGVSEEMTELTAAAVDQLEMLNSFAFSDDALLAGGSLEESLPGYAADPLRNDPNAYLRWSVEDLSFSLKRITVTAGLRSSNMGARQVQFETFRVLSQ